MVTERQRTVFTKRLNQLGITNPADVEAVLDFIYTLATCAIEYEDEKAYEKEKRYRTK